MRVRATAKTLLIGLSLCVLSSIPASADQQKNGTWNDSNGKLRSRTDLDQILKQHKQWLESQGKFGNRADLSNADLTGADLRGVNLSGADLSDADLSGAELSHADLSGVNLSGADLSGADLSRADLVDADLTNTDLRFTDLSHAILKNADFTDADLTGATLREVSLLIPAEWPATGPDSIQANRVNFTRADLTDADLNGAHLSYADLTATTLRKTNLAGADISHVYLGRALFEPRALPSWESIASASDLELVTYEDNPGPLSQLRKQFQDAGYREQERAITCALNRHDANPSRLRASIVEKWKSIRRKPFDVGKIPPLRSFIEGTFKWIAFDWTCQYGMSYGRPLRIVGLLWLLFTAVYTVFIHWPGRSGIYVVGTRQFQGRAYTQAMQVRPRPLRATSWWKAPFLWLKREWRVLRAAMFFSLMSAFNIGFRDINFGRWLRLLTKREYDLKAVGWARTVSGFQSLISVYLIALWVLTYFGRPFG